MLIQFKVHRVDSSFNSLYKEVPPSILPRDYGGDGPSFSELTGPFSISFVRFSGIK